MLYGRISSEKDALAPKGRGLIECTLRLSVYSLYSSATNNEVYCGSLHENGDKLKIVKSIEIK